MPRRCGCGPEGGHRGADRLRHGQAEITSSHGVRIAADVLFEDAEFESSDILYLPGGMPGTENLYAHQGLCELVRRFAAEGKRVAALCAAPSVLGRLACWRAARPPATPAGRTSSSAPSTPARAW